MGELELELGKPRTVWYLEDGVMRTDECYYLDGINIIEKNFNISFPYLSISLN